MKPSVTIFLMIALVAPQYINASPMPQDESMEGCTCSTKTSETHTGLILGKCNHKYNDRFYCYVDKTLLPHCCEEESQRFVNYCVNYSICGGHPDGPPVSPYKETM